VRLHEPATGNKVNRVNIAKLENFSEERLSFPPLETHTLLFPKSRRMQPVLLYSSDEGRFVPA